MQISRRRASGAAISLVAMIDVLMILLVFFMVTSTYLDLDMVPLAGAGDGAPASVTQDDPPQRLLVRLGADGSAVVQGQSLGAGAVAALVAARLSDDPRLEVLVLPSAFADVQALATLMDTLVAAGATRLRIVQLEPVP